MFGKAVWFSRGRSQFSLPLALGFLVFIWVTRWQMGNLSLAQAWTTYGPEHTTTTTAADHQTPSALEGDPHHHQQQQQQQKDEAEKQGYIPTGPGQALPPDLDLSDPDAPFVGWPLQRACDEVEEWVPGVVFLCDNNFGGVGNMRNFMLTCVRYAIEAGASGLVMPRIRKRRDDDIKAIFGGKDLRPFGYLFDEENFRTAMGENCPQMTIYDDWTTVPNVRYVDAAAAAAAAAAAVKENDDTEEEEEEKEKAEEKEAEQEEENRKRELVAAAATRTTAEADEREPEVEILDPRQLSRIDGDRCDFAELDHQSDRFGVRFREHIRNPENGMPPSPAHPRLFRGNTWPGVLWEWPVFRDGPELANTFGGLCKFNKTIMRLGKKALANMQAFAREHHAQHVFSSPGPAGGSDSSKRPNKKYYNNNNNLKTPVRFSDAPFMGMHLRSEADAEAFWPSYEEQQTGYLRKAQDLGFTVAYVASGDLNETHKLEAAAREQLGMTLVSKEDLLQGEDLAQLHALSWDQQGLVDYIVLAGADYFAGIGRSSFSISLTQKRHLRADGLYTRPYKLRPGGYGRSFIVGPMEKYYDHWLFIWDAMWP